MRLRKTSQILFFILFLFFFFNTKYTGLDELPLKVAIFLQIDPLISIVTFLTERDLSALWSLSLIIIFISIALGRIFCGWICPFGTIHDITSKIIRKRKKSENGKFKWKYYILIILLVCSLFALNLTGLLDPISLLIRSISVSLSPMLDFFTNFIADVLYSTKVEFIQTLTDHVFGFMKKFFLNFNQQHFLNSGLILVVFIVLLLINYVSNRFFCKNLCPLGALLGCFARFGFLKRNLLESCNSCGKCLGNCKMTIKDEKAWVRSECLVCLRCRDVCPSKSIEFTLDLPSKRDKGIDLERRRVLTNSIYGLLLVGGIRLKPDENMLIADKIRPPGSVDEPEFKRRCVKCGECMRVCLTNVLQPAFLETGLEGFWTPIMNYRYSYCEYNCTLCTQVCPSGAIEKLNKSEKIKRVIGLAYIDPARCIPYREANNCIVCEEFCPTSPKAIYFEKVQKIARDGTLREVMQPKVDYSKCIGCGVCEFKCPVYGRKAIYVLPPESKNIIKDNSLNSDNIY
jgi:MauM/NapG family ferredoxin protein